MTEKFFAITVQWKPREWWAREGSYDNFIARTQSVTCKVDVFLTSNQIFDSSVELEFSWVSLSHVVVNESSNMTWVTHRLDSTHSSELTHAVNLSHQSSSNMVVTP